MRGSPSRKARVLSPEFRELWERIKRKTRYAVKIDTEALLNEVVPEIERAEVAPPRVTIKTWKGVRAGYGALPYADATTVDGQAHHARS